MYCTRCGSICEDTAKFCERCGEALTPPGSPPPPPPQPPYDPYDPRLDPEKIASQAQTFFVLSIVSTVLCCRIFGIVAIVNANRARKLIQQGDVAGAYKALGDAKIWTYLSIGVGLLLILSRLAEAVGVYS